MAEMGLTNKDLLQPEQVVTVAESFTQQLRALPEQAAMVSARIDELTRENDNIVHRIERPDCKFAERGRLSTQLQRVRLERRMLKDWLHGVKPVLDLLRSDKGKNLHNLTAGYLGAARRAKPVSAQSNNKTRGVSND